MPMPTPPPVSRLSRRASRQWYLVEARASPGERQAVEPAPAVGIELLDFRALELGHVAFHGEADARLRVREVAIAFGKLVQQVPIEHEARGGIERVGAILFVDGLAQPDGPVPVLRLVETRFEEI